MANIFHHPVFGAVVGQSDAAPRSTVPLSMIDVVFLLLTFLLLGQFPLAEGLLSMPLAGQSGSPVKTPAHVLWVQVKEQDGQTAYRLNDWPATRSSQELVGHVRSFVRASGADQVAVVVQSEPGVPFDRVVDLWEACRAMGITNLALPAEPDRPAVTASAPEQRNPD